MKKEKKRIALDDVELKAEISAFLREYRAKNGIDLTETQAVRMLIRAGLGLLATRQLRLEDKERVGLLRK